MDDREQVFQSIREALAPLKEKRTPYPDWDPALGDAQQLHAEDAAETEAYFAAQVAVANGRFLDGWTGLRELLIEGGATEGYVDPQLVEEAREALGEIPFATRIDRERIDNYGFGITLADGAIAETGSVVLADRSSPFRLGALAPWIHVAVIRRASLVRSVREAVARFGGDPNIVFATGPSKTADVEGILIEGVHGPGCQVCLLV